MTALTENVGYLHIEAGVICPLLRVCLQFSGEYLYIACWQVAGRGGRNRKKATNGIKQMSLICV